MIACVALDEALRIATMSCPAHDESDIETAAVIVAEDVIRILAS